MQKLAERPSLTEQLVKRLRTMVVDGRLRPGARINEVHLATQLGVSRTPLREALSRLTTEGTIRMVPRRGFFAAPLSAAEFEQLYAIRPLLDPEALRLAGLPSPAALAHLQKLNRRLRAETDPERILELDDQWHLELLRPCPNRVLLDMIGQIMQRTRRYELALMRERKNLHRATGQHEEILKALKAGKLGAACRSLRRNMQHGYEPIVSWLQEREAPSFIKVISKNGRRAAALLFLSFLFGSFACAAEKTPTIRDLEGLWECSRSFGPDLRGPIHLDRTKDGWSADLKGRLVVGKSVAGRLEFDFGEGQVLRVRFGENKNPITGWWTQRQSPFYGYRFITPVELRAEGENRYRGELGPLEDRITFYMPISIDAEGKATTYLRNPERNAGRQLNVKRVEFSNGEVRLFGFPFGSKEEQVVGRGSVDFDNDLMSIYVQRVGQAYEFQRVRPKQDSGFYPRGNPPSRYRYSPPPERADGWPVGTLEEVGISREAMERFVQMLVEMPMTEIGSSDLHAVLIARHGKLVLEEYFHGFDRNTLHDTRSAAKSLTATIFGAAVQAGLPLSLDTPVYRAMHGGEFPAGLEPRKKAMTAEHLLTMSSGFYCDDNDPKAPGAEDTMQEQNTQPDWYRFALDLPMAMDPGEKAIYCSTNPNLLGGVMSRATGRPLEELFREFVAEPLGIKRYALNTQPTGEPYMGGGTHFEPRDFMKLGQLMMDGGTWRGKRIVNEEWAKKATSPLYPIGQRGYGYLWWSQDYPYQDRKVRAFYAAGNGGQIVMAIPELKLVINFWGGNYNDPALFIPQRKYVPEYILPAVAE